MLSTYFKITFRNTWKHKVFLLINIAGLAVACCFCLLIFWCSKMVVVLICFNSAGVTNL